MEKTQIEGVFTNADYLDVSDVEVSPTETKELTEKSNKLKIRDRSRSPKHKKSHRSHRHDQKYHRRYKRHDSNDSRSSSNSSKSYLNQVSGENRGESRRVRQRVTRSLSSCSDKEKSKEKDDFKPKTNFFGDKKSKWSTVEEDELKQKEPHVIQVISGTVKEQPKIKSEEKVSATKISEDDIKIYKYNPPTNSTAPDKNWRLFTFKDKEKKDIHKIDEKAYYVIGKDEKSCNIVINHPSCSRHHAVIQFLKSNKDATIGINIIDLKSTNGTFVNKMRLEPGRNYELKVYDVLNFGNSTRDYVVMQE